NLAYALLITDALASELIPAIKTINQELREKAQLYKDVSVLSRTHGQPASPTTIGKELVVYIVRLERQLKIVESVDFLGKMNGATGNFNAHVVAYPKVDWIAASEKFVRGLSLTPNLYTTQIESHDFLAELFDALRRINTVLLDFSRDMWLYISFDVFKQTVKKEEVGSSTMPHKVNPIDFENAEGNLGMANALFEHFSAKLPISRLQRDLSDSTVLRNIGVAFGYSLLAYKSLSKGLGKVDLNYDKIAQDLENNLGVLSEAIQSVMRSHKQEGAYEELKELTRGKKLTKDLLLAFIRKLDIPMIEKEMLIKLTPADYTGLAGMLVERHMK
ncbi:adenylosuccinate lyase, partial [Candidatus Peregrinibacteria bacterium]|nr:adenylosuccinate lyase [Candidatus Peregrinibacteria bacterium]